jgi:choline dehydrogenase-like flavoprotein
LSRYTATGDDRLECDVLIVGSGAGGSAVADVMTAAGRDVLMVEEGAYLPHDRVPEQLPDAFLNMWRCSGLTVALGPAPVAYAEGRCVGGGTEINTAIFQRAPDEIVEGWRQSHRVDDLSPLSLKPYYDRAAAAVSARLTTGPLGRPSDLLREAGERLGWKVEALRRSQRHCVGTNLCLAGCPTGGKQSMSSTLIPLALARGLRLVSQCRVDRLEIRSGRVSGARATARDITGRRVRLAIRARAVFVCAGAIHTPALLLRSGIKRAVGRSLRLHPTVKALARFDETVDAASHRVALYSITEFMPAIRIGGSLTTPGVFGMGLAEDWENRRDLIDDFPRTATYYAMARAEGVGRIDVLPGAHEPLVRYRLKESDWPLLATGLDALVKAMFAAGARRVFPGFRQHAGWTDAASASQEIARGLPRKLANLFTIHLFSSCPMGEDEARCPIDSWGRVRGVEGLHVADGSMIPDAPGVNPQATIMALAYRTAEHAGR